MYWTGGPRDVFCLPLERDKKHTVLVGETPASEQRKNRTVDRNVSIWEALLSARLDETSYTPFINIAIQGVAVGLCQCSSISYRPIGSLRNSKRLDTATIPIFKVFDHKTRGSRWQTPARSDKMEEHDLQRGLLWSSFKVSWVFNRLMLR
ncbi:hypothetical protein ARMSODRAFT_968859 [Armillaria solidipes]|uniref:Uncharacterized protein n=1 Tax=Armillaria solidipes TaxID=1076256 RepID=A0A2H3CA91_9AGAR|nr:hypothetical protein ARMSODRAFT_968859 [Armillaria solidipes]